MSAPDDHDLVELTARAALLCTIGFAALIEPVGDRLVERIDATAGPNWMPAARSRVTDPATPGADR